MTAMSTRKDADGLGKLLSVAHIQSQVDAAADGMMAEGENPTVRALCQKLGRSPNLVTPALGAWRQRLQQRLREARSIPGLPDDVIAYVRLGYEAAARRGAPAREVMTGNERENVLRQVIGALESQITLLQDERATMLERLGRLETQLDQARFAEKEFARVTARMQRALDTAHAKIGTLSASPARPKPKKKVAKQRTTRKTVTKPVKKTAAKSGSRKKSGRSARRGR